MLGSSVHQGQCLTPAWWILQCEAAPVNQDRHPHWKSSAQTFIRVALAMPAEASHTTALVIASFNGRRRERGFPSRCA